jgi:putative Holliday junction resolvase
MRGNLLARRFYVGDLVVATYSQPAFASAASAMLCGAMPALILPLVEAATHWPQRGSLIGLDLGTKTIGVAASDPDRRLATGVETISRKNFTADAARLLAIAKVRNAEGFVLGLPLNMDGSEGPRAQSTRAFARNFSRLTDLAIALWDERLSTVAVERELIGMDMSRARRAKVIDEHAAIFILQGALDRLAALKRSGAGG